jgi:hypothetical protein
MGSLHVLVRIEGQGYGYMDRAQYEAIPEPVRDRVELLAACPTEEKARWLHQHLPQTWRDATLAWRSDGKGTAQEVAS